MFEYGIHRDVCRLFDRVAVHAAADRGKGNTVYAVFMCQLQAALIATAQQRCLVIAATVPDRADRVDHVYCRQPVAAGECVRQLHG